MSALFWVFGVLAATTSWSTSEASLSKEVSDYALAMAQLSERRVVGADISETLRDALERAQGRSFSERVLSAANKAAEAERFLEAYYRMRGVDVDVLFGFTSDAEISSWLQGMRASQQIQACPRCLDVGLAGASVFSDSLDEALNVSWGPALPFSGFGKPFFGAVFSFGDVVAVEAA